MKISGTHAAPGNSTRAAFAAFLCGASPGATGAVVYLAGVAIALSRLLVDPSGPWQGWAEALVRYSGVPVVAGAFLVALELAVFLPQRRLRRGLTCDPPPNLRVDPGFDAHFLNVALSSGVSIVECPITSHPRIGLSKGGNVSDMRVLEFGLRMIRDMVSGWRDIRRLS